MPCVGVCVGEGVGGGDVCVCVLLLLFLGVSLYKNVRNFIIYELRLTGDCPSHARNDTFTSSPGALVIQKKDI